MSCADKQGAGGALAGCVKVVAGKKGSGTPWLLWLGKVQGASRDTTTEKELVSDAAMLPALTKAMEDDIEEERESGSDVLPGGAMSDEES
jgi:hypothetical protein